MKTKVTDIRDLVGVLANVEVVSPVLTLRGAKEVDDDDDVEIVIVIGGVRIETTVEVHQYRAMMRERNVRQHELPLEEA